MSIDRFFRRHPLACILVALHTLLVGAYAWIELNHAWNDMDPTMLVMAGLHLADYPIHLLLQPLFDRVDQTGSYLAALLVVGGAYWFAIGAIIEFAGRRLLRLLLGRRSARTVV
jgi:hypothetical protein